MGLGIRSPFAHAVRIFLGVILYGFRGAAIRIPFPQDGIHSAAFYFIVASLDGLIGLGLCLIRIVGYRITLVLQLFDRFFELRYRGTDIR